MDLELINIVREGDVDAFKQLQERNPNKLHQETPVGNTLLHLAAKFGHFNFLVEVCERCPSLITKINKFGDTALHVGARTQKKLEFIQYLIDRMASSCSSDLLRSQNHKGDSALHEALRYCHPDVAKLLIQKDPHLCLLVNNASESPVFLAVTKGYYDVLIDVLNYSPSAPCDGPKGWTALHACAISEEKGLVPSYMAEKLLQLKPEMGRVVDIYGRTPLHYAVDSKKISIVELLLQHDPSIAYIQDKDGWSPLHVAVSRWSTFGVDPKSEDAILQSIVEKIIGYCPDSEYLVDNGGNNILHLLLLESKMLSGSYYRTQASAYWLLGQLGSLEELLNQPNNDGNTPLHLATLYGLEIVAEILTWNARVDKKARNNNNLTAYDIARHKLRLAAGKGRRRTWSRICSSVSPNDDDHRISSSGPLLWIATLNPSTDQWPADKQDAEKDAEKEAALNEKRKKEEHEARRKLSKTHMLVATLIATVAFAAAFQMPGGYESGGDDQQGNDNKKKGMAVLAGEAAFMAFLIFDVIALSCSVLTLLLYFFSEIANYAIDEATIGPTRKIIIVSELLIFVAIVAMTLAFTCAVFGVLVRTHSLWIGIVTVLVFLSIPFLSIFIIVKIYNKDYHDD